MKQLDFIQTKAMQNSTVEQRRELYSETVVQELMGEIAFVL